MVTPSVDPAPAFNEPRLTAPSFTTSNVAPFPIVTPSPPLFASVPRKNDVSAEAENVRAAAEIDLAEDAAGLDVERVGAGAEEDVAG